MPYIYSTLSNDNRYPVYHESTDAGPNVAKASVLIKGGANVAQKRYIDEDGTNTPAGVRTEVTEDELALLQQVPEFCAHVDRGFLEITSSKEKVSEIVVDMTEADKSAQYSAEDYLPGGRAFIAGIEAPKVSTEENE